MDKNVNVGIIGYGLAGRVFHAPLIAAVPGFQISMISTSDAVKAEAIKQKYPATSVVAEYKEIIGNAEIDLVIIASPNEFHFTQAREALQAGKSVVVDKPITITVNEAEELISLAKEKGKMITAFQNRRWDGDFLTVQKIITGGKLGEIVEAEIHYDRFRNYIKPDTWKEEARPGGGIIYDLGSHIIDQVQVLFGMPHAITAFLLTQRAGARTPDNFEIIYHYPKLKVTLKAGMLVRAKLPRYILLGTKGSFVKYGLDAQEAQLNAGLIPGDNGYGEDPESDWGILRTDVDGEKFEEEIVKTERGDYLQFYKNIYHALVDNESLIVKPEQALNNIRIIELAIKSSDEGRTIPLNES